MSAQVPRLSVVLPAYREAEHLAKALSAIRSSVAGIGVSYELVVVDDGSPDATWELLRELATQWPELRALRLARNFGKEGALLAGLDASRGEAVVVMDADLQHPPELIPEMYRLWEEEGFGVVNAVKRERGREASTKRWLTRFYYGLFAKLAGVAMENSSDFKLLDQHAVDVYCRLPERNTFFRGLVAWMGFSQKDLPFDVAARAGGTTSWSLVKLAGLAVSSVVSFSAIPLQAVTILGVGFFLFAIVLGAQTVWIWLSGQAVPGFATVILLLILIGSILMIALGVIGQYVAKIYDEVKRRPRYLVRDEARGRGASPEPAADTDRRGRWARETGPAV
jgi:glycosyltransferase involved in cell wall biosynthesis